MSSKEATWDTALVGTKWRAADGTTVTIAGFEDCHSKEGAGWTDILFTDGTRNMGLYGLTEVGDE